MSGNQPQDNSVPEGTAFPTIGDYVIIPGPGDADYVPPADPDLIGFDAGDNDGPDDLEDVEFDDGFDENGDPIE